MPRERRDGSSGILGLPAQLWMASFWAPVMTPAFNRSFPRCATQATKAPWFFAPAAQWAIRSEIVQPVVKNVFGTPESQLPMTTVGAKFEFGSQSTLSGTPSRSASGNQPTSRSCGQRQVLGRLHAVRQVGVDGRLHELVPESDRVPVRDRGARLNGVGRVKKRQAVRVGARKHREIDAESGVHGSAQECGLDRVPVSLRDRRGRDGDRRIRTAKPGGGKPATLFAMRTAMAPAFCAFFTLTTKPQVTAVDEGDLPRDACHTRGAQPSRGRRVRLTSAGDPRRTSEADRTTRVPTA